MPHLSVQRDGKSSRDAGRTAVAGRRLTRPELAGAATGPRRGHGFTACGARRKMGAAMGVSE